jgi:hypothetical protein
MSSNSDFATSAICALSTKALAAYTDEACDGA